MSYLQITDKPHDIGQAVRQAEQLGARVGVFAIRPHGCSVGRLGEEWLSSRREEDHLGHLADQQYSARVVPRLRHFPHRHQDQPLLQAQRTSLMVSGANWKLEKVSTRELGP